VSGKTKKQRGKEKAKRKAEAKQHKMPPKKGKR